MKISPANPDVVENPFDAWTKAVAGTPTRRKTLQLLCGGFFGTLFGLGGSKSWAASSITSDAPSPSTPSGADDSIADRLTPEGLAVCTNQDYALCAGVRCFVYNNVAYCRCNLKFGNSVSRKLSYPGGNVCNFNAEGPSNGYVVSTFSVPYSSNTPSGKRALYFCPPSPNSGAYASCDGGICFASTRGQSFPGLGHLGEDQIVCSCTIAQGTAAKFGYQIFGPNPCDPSFFDNCKKDVATGKNGTHLYEAAPTGSYEIGAIVLNEKLPHFNMCVHRE